MVAKFESLFIIAY